MTVVLLDAEHPGQADQALVVGEDPDDVGAPADLLVEAFQRVCGTQLGSVLGGQRVEGQQVFLGAGHTAVAAGLAPQTTLHERSPVGEAREAPGRARGARAVAVEPRLDSESRPDPTFLRRTTRPQTITRPPKRPPPEQPVTTPATRK
jgi:hypothetical protein